MKSAWKGLLKRWIGGSYPLDADVSRVVAHPDERLVGLLFDGGDFGHRTPWTRERASKGGRSRRGDAGSEVKAEQAAWFSPPAA